MADTLKDLLRDILNQCNRTHDPADALVRIREITEDYVHNFYIDLTEETTDDDSN